MFKLLERKMGPLEKIPYTSRRLNKGLDDFID